MVLQVKLNKEEVDALDLIKKNFGAKTYSKTVKQLILKKRVLSRVNKDLASLAHCTSLLAARAESLIEATFNKEDLGFAKDDLKESVLYVQEILRNYSSEDEIDKT